MRLESEYAQETIAKSYGYAIINIDENTMYYPNGQLNQMTQGGTTVEYAYDNEERLISESKGGTTLTYTYNDKGLLSTAGGDTYAYDNQGRLTNFNGQTFEYDAMGNPIRYKGNTFNWIQGRKLGSGSMNGKTFSYEYDPNGIRYKKTVDGTTTEYYLADDQIMAENRGTNLIVYIYDAMGIAGMIYNGAYYLYERNALGDVYRIRDANGTEVAYYEYDAWGNITTKTGTMADINPFRCRGYYYDTETGFYYLQTRYMV